MAPLNSDRDNPFRLLGSIARGRSFPRCPHVEARNARRKGDRNGHQDPIGRPRVTSQLDSHDCLELPQERRGERANDERHWQRNQG